MARSNARTSFSARRLVVDIVQTAIQVALVFAIFSALIGRFVIQQSSMEPNFHEGERVVVSKLDSLWTDWFVETAHAAGGRARSPFGLHRGQIAVFYATASREGDPLIKRVVGVPGDVIEVRDGAVLVNDQLLDEPYVAGQLTGCQAVCGPIALGPDTYFMMGDNRDVSRDSRSFGPIHVDQVVGRVVMRYWPLEQAEFFP